MGLCCNEPVAIERIENSVAPRQCPLWVAKRIVVRRSANDANQGRDFRDIQFVNRLVEIKLCTQSETMNRTRAILPEEDFVHVRSKQSFFAESQLQDHGHGKLSEFPFYGALAR